MQSVCLFVLFYFVFFFFGGVEQCYLTDGIDLSFYWKFGAQFFWPSNVWTESLQFNLMKPIIAPAIWVFFYGGPLKKTRTWRF